MSGPIPIKSRASRGKLRNDALLSSSFVAASPMAQEIIARDLEECSTDESDHDSDWEHEPKDMEDEGDDVGDLPGPSMYLRPSNITFGSARPATALPFADEPSMPSEREIEESRAAERSLLRDNHMLPPKHPRHANESAWRKFYRAAFSTKVRRPEIDGELPKAVETTPLLQAPDGYLTPTAEEVEERFEEAVAAQLIRTTWQREAKTLFQYSRSLAATFLLHYSVTVASVYTVGRIGSLELGAVSLATMTANITCYAVVQGLSTSLDTLCSQAYGSGHKHLVGLQLQRMTYFLWILLVPICLLWWYSEPLLASIVPEPETARLASSYLRILILGTPGVAAFESGKRFVQAQGLFHATTYVLMVGAPLSFFANWFFVYVMEWSFVGAGVAVVCTQNLLPILLAAYVWLIEGADCWNGLNRKAFNNWGPMIKLALPGMIMVLAQYLAFEMLTLAASQFSTTHLAAQSILVTMTSTTFQTPFALSIAASTRVANLIGAKLADGARICARVSIIAAILVGLFDLTLIMTLRYQLPWIFTKDPAVAELVAQIAPTCAVLQIFDALAACSHGLLRGIGRQGIGGYANLFSYYLIALPISFATGFSLGWNVQGLWLGVICGLFTVAIIEYWYLYQYDWERAVYDAESRMESDSAGPHMK